MIPLSRSARVLVIIAAVSFVVMALLYAFPSHSRQTLLVTTDVCWGWAAAFAAFCCFNTAGRATTAEQRRTWRWIGAGCASFFAGALVWTYYDFWLRAAPPYPSLADAGFLGIYLCLIVGIVTLVRGQPTRRPDPELILDTVLVTFTVGALAYEYLLEPLLAGATPHSTAGLLTSIGWSTGGIAVLWMVLIQMLRRTVFPAVTAALVLPGIVALAIGNLVYAVVALGGTYQPGGPLDLTWDAGLLMIAAAAALAPDRALQLERDRATPTSGLTARVVALIVGLAGMSGMAIVGIVRPEPGVDVAIIIGIGMLIIGARVLYSLGVDRRYAQLLEDEVANQTRSLMSSLGATASAERSLRLLMEAVPDAISVLDREGRVLDENPAGRSLVNAERSGFDWLDSAGTRIARKNLAAAFDGELRRFEVPFQRPDGSDGTAQVLFAPVRESGRIPKVLALVRDITEQRRAQTQLQQADKLAAMGQLVSGVAHEINNPAAIISGFAQTLLLDQLTPDQRETLQMMYDEATRIGRITSNLLAFARAGSKQRALVDMNDIARRTFALRSYHLSTLNIAVSLDLDPSEPKIWADASELQQMILNLLINAEQALVTVDGPRTIVVRTRTDEGEARLEIADSGPGIPAEIRSKIFDPFFTTKPEGVGTGLGLSICYGIAREHGGRIWVESEPGHGARFGIALPRDPREDSPPEPTTSAHTAAAGGALTVLVVDDETALRNALLRFLGRRGIQGEGVSDGAEALRVLQQRRFDVIVSDVRMPGMSGREFLETLQRDRPDLVSRVVFSTGDTFAPDTAALLKEAGVPTVTKPFDFAMLERVIREVVTRVAAGPPKASG